VKELKGFTRLLLQPGQTRRVTFHLPVNQLAYDEDALVVEPGTIKLMLGSHRPISAARAASSLLAQARRL